MFDLFDFLEANKAWSCETFGEAGRYQGIIERIRKELEELEANPLDIFEWVDVILLAFDGAWRAGYSSEEIVLALQEKQKINFARSWAPNPDPSQPTEHIRKEEPDA